MEMVAKLFMYMTIHMRCYTANIITSVHEVIFVVPADLDIV